MDYSVYWFREGDKTFHTYSFNSFRRAEFYAECLRVIGMSDAKIYRSSYNAGKQLLDDQREQNRTSPNPR